LFETSRSVRFHPFIELWQRSAPEQRAIVAEVERRLRAPRLTQRARHHGVPARVSVDQ
jgi:hypothetical protein